MQNGLLILLALTILSPTLGELFRIPFLGFELLPSDILIPIFFIIWGFDKLKDPVLRLGRVGKCMLFFALIAFLSFGFNAFRFPFSEMLAALIHMLRTGMYLLLALLVFDLLKRDNRILPMILGLFVLSSFLIAILGFLQLHYFPSFLALGLDISGWDPHIGRLTSTWLDPNFVGGFLAFCLPLLLSLALYFYRQKKRFLLLLLGVVSAVSLLALYLTFSRSAYLAFLLGVFVLAFFKSRKLLVAIITLSLLGFAFSARVQERVLTGVDSAKALFGAQSQHALDPTSRLRVKSWNVALSIIADHPWIGIGYNRYPYEYNQRGAGLISDHASGGSDSSLLTLWATTGIFGLLSFLAIGFVAALSAFRRIWKKTDFKSFYLAGLFSGFIGIMLHSIFVNSLLYALMMVSLYSALALLDEL